MQLQAGHKLVTKNIREWQGVSFPPRNQSQGMVSLFF